MPAEIGVRCELVSTTMLVVLPAGSTQLPCALHSWEGRHPPHVPLQPSSPQVLPLQSGLQLLIGPEPPAPAVAPLPASPPVADAPAPDEPLAEGPPLPPEAETPPAAV